MRLLNSFIFCLIVLTTSHCGWQGLGGVGRGVDDGGGDGKSKLIPVEGTPANKSYFAQYIDPLLQPPVANETNIMDPGNKCYRCHNEPRFEGEGPLSIYTYNVMVALLMNGSTAEGNQLISKMRNIVSHYGGDQCNGDSNNSPCKEIKAWWVREVTARGGTKGNGTPMGEITEIFQSGLVKGWAADLDAPSSPIAVKFYVDGLNGAKILVGSTIADKSDTISSFPGNHGIQFTIPEEYRKGAARVLYAEGVDTGAGPAGALSKSPFSFRLYSPKKTPAVIAAFDSLKSGLTASCGACHGFGSAGVTLDAFFYDYMMNPPPHLGGSGTAIVLYQRGSGNNHSKGNQCTGTTCQEIAAWYNMHFPQ